MDEPKAFQTYGIRGKHPKEVNEELALGLGDQINIIDGLRIDRKEVG